MQAVVLDLSATPDLDVPRADMLARLQEDLHRRNVRLMLAGMIMPVRQMLALAGVRRKIRPVDVFVGPTEAVLDPLSAQDDADGVQELLRRAAATVRLLWQSHGRPVTADQPVALAAIGASSPRRASRTR